MISPLAEPYTLRLQPGEKYTGPAGLLGNVPEYLREISFCRDKSSLRLNSARAVRRLASAVALPAKDDL